MPPFTTGQVLCGNDERGRGGCNIVHIAEVAEDYANIPKPAGDWPDTRGLRALQDGHEEWLNGSAIDVALQVFHDYLPPTVRDMIHVQSTDIANLFASDTTTFDSAVAGRYNRVFRQFSKTEYSLWPVNVYGNHWELLVMRKQKMEKMDNSKKGFGPYRRISQMAIIDTWPSKRKERRELVENRLTAIFTSQGYQFARNYKRVVSVPVQHDGWSCGLRVFWEAKELMGRIVLLDEYDESLWDNIDRYFNAHTVRWEMVGLNTSRAVREMNYKARVAIELVDEVEERDAGGDVLRSKDAAKELKPVGDSPLPAKRKRPASDTGPEQPPATRLKTASPKSVRKVNPRTPVHPGSSSAHFSSSTPVSPLPPDGTPERPVVVSESPPRQATSPATNTQTSSPSRATAAPKADGTPESPVSVSSSVSEMEEPVALQYSSSEDDNDLPMPRSSAPSSSAPEPSKSDLPPSSTPPSEYIPRPILESAPAINQSSANTSKTSIAPARRTPAPAPAPSTASSAYTPRPILGSPPAIDESSINTSKTSVAPASAPAPLTSNASNVDRLRSTYTRTPSNTPTDTSKGAPKTTSKATPKSTAGATPKTTSKPTSKPIASDNNSGKQPLRFPLTNGPSTKQAKQQSGQILRNVNIALRPSPGPNESDPSHSKQGQ